MTNLAVVVPARNEEATIADCLESLVHQDADEPFTIVVVANGCTDRTVQVARGLCADAEQHGRSLVVVETSERGKAKALNLGDLHCPADAHRLYVDADVTLSTNAVSSFLSAVDAGTGLAAPTAVLDISMVPRLLRPYWRCWQRLPTVRGQVIGGGVYGLSASGRGRWTLFPDVIADDLFARRHFRVDESVVLRDAAFTTKAPDSTRQTIAVLSRWRRGNLDQRNTDGPLPIQRSASWHELMWATDDRPPVVDLAVFVTLTFAVRLCAAFDRRGSRWEQDAGWRGASPTTARTSSTAPEVATSLRGAVVPD